MFAGTKIIIYLLKKSFMEVFCHISRKGCSRRNRRIKSNIDTKIHLMSLGRDWIIFQEGRSICQFLSTLCGESTIIYVMADEIDRYKSEDPFRDPVFNRSYWLNTCQWGMFEWGDHTLVAQFKAKKVW